MTKNSTLTKPTINRIIIGDVGSGKTIVAFLIALCFQKNLTQTQVALTAPTEVLAYQHYQSFLTFLTTVKDSLKQHFPITIYLASGKYFINGEQYTKKKFETELTKIRGNIFWIGTHAIFYNEAVTPELIFIDEQHRFGVQQRQKLTLTSRNPHFVSLSATPIPRTLALTFYESLQPHFLDTLASRNPIITTQETFENFDTNILPQIQREVALGHKVYVICSLIEDSEDSDMWSTTKTTKLLEEHFPSQVLTVHGKDKAKKSILEQFKTDDEKSILVATTVVEVGVDVPQATLVVILNSERFGLSALHQIRGRVGRNDYEKNYCILVTWDKFKFIKRLSYLKEIHSGFALAEKDLELRGAGDVMGKMQSGFGQDFEDIVQLDPAIYEQVTNLTASLDYENLEDLPRLKHYLLTKIKEIHQE
jgi:ATP-dependent DNA helicase RecG